MIAKLDHIDDPAALARAAFGNMTEHQENAVLCAKIRARAITALYARDHSYKSLGVSLGLSTPRVGQIVSAVGPDVLGALKAWAPVGRQLTDIAGTINVALEILRDSAQFDRQALVDLKILVRAYRKMLHGDDVTHDDSTWFIESATYLNAVLVIWQRSTRKGRQ